MSAHGRTETTVAYGDNRRNIRGTMAPQAVAAGFVRRAADEVDEVGYRGPVGYRNEARRGVAGYVSLGKGRNICMLTRFATAIILLASFYKTQGR